MKCIISLNTPAHSFFYYDARLQNFSHSIVKYETDATGLFSLRSVFNNTKCSREYSQKEFTSTDRYVSEIVRMTPLSDLQTQALLMEEFFHRVNYAISIGSVWAWNNRVKEVLEVFKCYFPEQHFLDLDFVHDLFLSVKMRANEVQCLKERCLYSER